MREDREAWQGEESSSGRMAIAHEAWRKSVSASERFHRMRSKKDRELVDLIESDRSERRASPGNRVQVVTKTWSASTGSKS